MLSPGPVHGSGKSFLYPCTGQRTTGSWSPGSRSARSVHECPVRSTVSHWTLPQGSVVCGQQLGEVQRRRAQEGRIDPVADERGAQVDLPPGVARRRGDRREVAREHLSRRHVRNLARRSLTIEGALVAAEEEQLVAEDGAAHRAAELVAPEAIIDLLAVGAESRQNGRGALKRRSRRNSKPLAVEHDWSPTWSPR